jgi:hypothetical protein
MPAFSMGKAQKCTDDTELSNLIGKEVTTTPMLTPGPGTYVPRSIAKSDFPKWRYCEL